MPLNKELLKTASFAVTELKKLALSKRAFVPAAGMMPQGGGGGMPPGMPMDPSMMGGMGGGGGMPPGAPMDPAMMGGGGGAPPMDPMMLMAMMGGMGGGGAPPMDPSLAGAVPQGGGVAPGDVQSQPEAPMPAGVQDKDKLLQFILRQNDHILKYITGGASPAGDAAKAAPQPAAQPQQTKSGAVMGDSVKDNAEMLNYLMQAHEAIRNSKLVSKVGEGIKLEPPKTGE